MNSAETQSADDARHLDLLAIFYYVKAGLAVLTIAGGLVYAGFGVLLLSNAGRLQDVFKEAPDDFPWPLLGGAAILAGFTLTLFSSLSAVGMFLAGRFLQRRVNFTYCLVIAGLCCMNMPLGTILGVFTIVVLQRPSVKALFDRSAAD